MEVALRRSLGSQAQHTHSLEDHTWSIQQSTTTHTKHIYNIQQQNSNYTHTHCELFQQTINKSKLSKDCKFKAVTDEQYREELFRDAFINGLFSPAIRQRLLENDTLSSFYKLPMIRQTLLT